jgi:DNA-binding response OmpR family regulator
MKRGILLIEDEPAVRLAIAKTLEARHYEVETCTTGGEAMRALAGHAFDLAILDINLPDATGWDVARYIRQRLGTALPIIVISAVTPRTARLREHAIAAVLQKPFPMESLLRLVAHHTDREGVSQPPAVQQPGRARS